MDETPPDASPEDRGHVIGVGMGGACPSCRAPVELGQKFCLECGAAIRFSRKTKSSALQAAVPRARSDRNFPWLPFIGVLILLLIGIGVALWTQSGSSKKTGKTTSSVTTDTDTEPDTDTSSTDFPTSPELPTTPTTDTIPSLPTTTTDTTPTGSTDSSTWPPGKDGWTVVLASLSQRLYTQDRANQRAVEAQQHSLTAGVLNSDEFSNLQAGFWVVFSGVYDSRSQAEGHLSDVTDAGYQGYVRQILSD